MNSWLSNLSWFLLVKVGPSLLRSVADRNIILLPKPFFGLGQDTMRIIEDDIIVIQVWQRIAVFFFCFPSHLNFNCNLAGNGHF